MQQNESVAEAMKRGMRRLASGVCIIAIEDEQGEKHAMTATSVTSLSDCPPSLLVCVNKIHRINSAFKPNAQFSVNILSESQQKLSDACADSSRVNQRFSSPDWCFSDDKAPWLSGSLAVFQCVSDQVVPYGTHDIIIGAIRSADSVESRASSALVYYDGSYANLP